MDEKNQVYQQMQAESDAASRSAHRYAELLNQEAAAAGDKRNFTVTSTISIISTEIIGGEGEENK